MAYLACAKKLLAAQDAIFPQFATHNAYSLAAIHELGRGKDYEFQCLHGMGETLYDQVVGREQLDRPCRVYAPVGTHETLLAYLVRRLLENGANSSFVNRLVDPEVSIDELVADQVEAAARLGGRPAEPIPLPRELFGVGRRNAKGLDLSSELDLRWLQEGLEASAQVDWAACPILGDGERHDADAVPVRNPSDHGDIVGTVREADTSDVDVALGIAAAAAPRLGCDRGRDRADCLERAADLLEEEMPALIGLAIREAGKSIPNAVAEVREAVDFCRYYAAQIRGEFKQRDASGARPGGLHRALELPARDLRGRGQRGAGGGQSRAGQTGRADAADRGPRRPPVPPGRRAARRLCSCCRGRAAPSARRWSPTRGSGASCSLARPRSPS